MWCVVSDSDFRSKSQIDINIKMLFIFFFCNILYFKVKSMENGIILNCHIKLIKYSTQ